MKHTSILTIALLFALLASVFTQGPLSPSGAPAPTMKRLDQIEARTIVNTANTPGNATNTFIINAPGSYFLTGNITGASAKHGISIQANDVTLDLNGFALIAGGGGAFRGINVPVAQSGFSLHNGSVRGWTDGGVRAEAAVTQAEKLRLTENTGAIGLAVGNGSLVTNCAATANGTGFSAAERTQISNCIATVNTGVGFECASYVNLLDCTASRNFGVFGIRTLGGCSILRCSAARNLPAGTGISAGVGCTITDCTASNNGSFGIVADSGSTITTCTAHSNANSGIEALSSSVSHCTADSNDGTGIRGSFGRVSQCTARNNASVGIFVNTGNVSQCTASNNGGVGIDADDGSVTNCVAHLNGIFDIAAKNAAVAFCRAGVYDVVGSITTGNR